MKLNCQTLYVRCTLDALKGKEPRIKGTTTGEKLVTLKMGD